MGLLIYINPEDSREATLFRLHTGALVDGGEGYGTIILPQATGPKLIVE